MTEKEKKLWLDIYNLADIIYEQAPWDKLTDSNFLGYVERQSGKLYYGSVLGNGGLYKGIIIVDDDSINDYVRMMEKDFTSIQLLNYQSGIMVSFLNKKDIKDDDKIIPRELGISFNEECITFKKYEKGYLPYNLSSNDLPLLKEILENIIMLYSYVEEEKIPSPKPGEMLCRYYVDDKTGYNNVVFNILLPKEKYFALPIDEALKNVSFNQSDDDLEIELANYIPIPTGDNYCDNRYKLDLYFAITNNTKDKIIDFKLYKEADYENIYEYYNERVSDIISFIIDNYKPKTIYVRDNQTKSLLSRLGELCNIEIIMKNRLEVIDNFIDLIIKKK